MKTYWCAFYSMELVCTPKYFGVVFFIRVGIYRWTRKIRQTFCMISFFIRIMRITVNPCGYFYTYNSCRWYYILVIGCPCDFLICLWFLLRLSTEKKWVQLEKFSIYKLLLLYRCSLVFLVTNFWRNMYFSLIYIYVARMFFYM